MGAVADDTRIVAALETLRYLRDQGARTIVLSHLGRPDGKVVPKHSSRPVAAYLGKRLGSPVAFAEDCVGPAAEAAAAALGDRQFQQPTFAGAVVKPVDAFQVVAIKPVYPSTR